MTLLTGAPGVLDAPPAGPARAPASGRLPGERALLGLLTLSVLGQRLALPLGGTSRVPVTLVAGLAVLVLGLRRGWLRIDRRRWRLALLAVALSAVSVLASTVRLPAFSLLSYVYLLLTYAPFIAITTGDRGALWRSLSDRALRLAELVAGLSLVQLAVQPLGWHHPEPVGSVVPGSFLLQGYNTTYPLHYLSPLYKSNGFVMLEPSFTSQLLGLGLLLALSRRARSRTLLLLAAGMVSTVAGTGFILLGAGLLVVAGSPQRRALRRLAPALAVGALLAAVTPLGTTLVGRLGEGTGKGSSTGERFTLPFTYVGGGWLASPVATWLGRGPGTAERALAAHLGATNGVVALAPLKLLYEYGLPCALAGLLLVLWCTLGQPPSFPVAVALVVSWCLLSGSLLQPATVLPMWLLAAALSPGEGLPVLRRAAAPRPPRPPAPRPAGPPTWSSP